MLLLPTFHLLPAIAMPPPKPSQSHQQITTNHSTTDHNAATNKNRKTTTSENRKTTTSKKRKKAQILTNLVLPKQEPPPESSNESCIPPDIEDFSPADARAIRSSLLLWYDQNKRILPWRRDPPWEPGLDRKDEALAYAVWVSEVMLQQTRVAAVVPYYNRWMERWPTVHDLAGATQEEVNEMWAGLGYYRRARFLLEGAKSIVERGEFPLTALKLREVKGIGEYTAGAIASIAFNEAVPVVDGNVIRVLTRLKAISLNPKESATVKTIWKLAGQLVDPSRPGDFNQALMELGATLCSVTSPSCSRCPISSQCRALALSKYSPPVAVTDYPVKVVKTKQRLEFAAVSVVEIAHGLEPRKDEEGHVFLLVKRPDEGLLAGLWEFPSVVINGKNIDQRARREVINEYLKKSFSLDLGTNCKSIFRQDVGEYVHVFSHIRLRMYVELLIISSKGALEVLDEGIERGSITWKYVEENSIQTMGLTSGIRKVYNMIQDFKKKELLPSPPKVARKQRSKRS